MDEALNNAIETIQKSEQESNAQHEYLEELKYKISAAEDALKENEKRCNHLKEEIQKKMKHLVNREVLLLSLKMRDKCLQERIDELKSEKKALLETMDQLRTQLKASRGKLCQQSREFIQNHEFFNQKTRSNYTYQGFHCINSNEEQDDVLLSRNSAKALLKGNNIHQHS